MMRAVIDTNILIRSLIKAHGTVGPIISRLRDGDYSLVYSAPLVDELVAKLFSHVFRSSTMSDWKKSRHLSHSLSCGAKR
jgi:predicted nucleic acid-binding protein